MSVNKKYIPFGYSFDAPRDVFTQEPFGVRSRKADNVCLSQRSGEPLCRRKIHQYTRLLYFDCSRECAEVWWKNRTWDWAWLMKVRSWAPGQLKNSFSRPGTVGVEQFIMLSAHMENNTNINQSDTSGWEIRLKQTKMSMDEIGSSCVRW